MSPSTSLHLHEPGIGPPLTASPVHLPRLLSARGLTVMVDTPGAQRPLLEDVSLELPMGQVTALVGPSGSGKSILLRTLLGLLPLLPGPICGQIWIQPPGLPPIDVLEGLEQATHRRARLGWQVSSSWRRRWRGRMRTLWGSHLSYLGQHSARALDPTRTIGKQLQRALTPYMRAEDKAHWRPRALEALEQVGFDRPASLLERFPGELSGGMARRVVLALVLAGGATTLFADEPTSGLDSDARTTFMGLIQALLSAGRLKTLLMVTHDLALAEQLAHSTVVLSGGQIRARLSSSELRGPTPPDQRDARQLWEGQRRLQTLLSGHTYDPVARGATHPPQPATPNPSSEAGLPALRVKGLSVDLYARRGWTWVCRPVLQDIQLELYPGEIVGLWGNNGAGKTTLASCLVGLQVPSSGRLWLEGQEVPWLPGRTRRAWARRVQMVFQHPHAALLPEMSVEASLLETARRVAELDPGTARPAVSSVLEWVGLQARRTAPGRELSGGELKRVSLARAMLVHPAVLIVDEPTDHVDAPLRARILELLLELAAPPHLTAILLISHDPLVLNAVTSRCLELREGRLRSQDPATLNDGGGL